MVRDYFALLDEPRQPWIDGDALTTKFHRLSHLTHPDRVHHANEEERQEVNRRYAELNAAYQCLQSPKERLQHLLALESGAKGSGIDDIPAETAELFQQLAPLCAAVDRLLARREEVASPLLRVQLFEEGLAFSGRIQDLLAKLRAREKSVHDQLRAMAPAWRAAPGVGDPARPAALPLAELERAYRSLSYLTRWLAQLQERLVQLTL